MPTQSELILRKLLESADIEVNGTDPWDIQVNDNRFYNRVLREAELGLGESYMDGWWDCQAIDQFVDRALRARLDQQIKGNWKILL
ncbi:MAG: cyclopropane-fatty-acyl-phospholipid synthase, partial [Chloroflexota bacterium]